MYLSYIQTSPPTIYAVEQITLEPEPAKPASQANRVSHTDFTRKVTQPVSDAALGPLSKCLTFLPRSEEKRNFARNECESAEPSCSSVALREAIVSGTSMAWMGEDIQCRIHLSSVGVPMKIDTANMIEFCYARLFDLATITVRRQIRKRWTACHVTQSGKRGR
ncbi:hypothetical protein VTI28DRAFT_4905 [Corynascus sepedonium]